MIAPEFLVQSLRAQYGDEVTDRILTGYATRRPVTFRVNTLKAVPEEAERAISALGLSVRRAPVPDAYIAEGTSEREIAETALYREGKIYLQSLSSMLPPFLLRPQEGENILDMTAAPGGKTSQIASLSAGKAFITACEKDKIRADRLKFNLAKLGVPRTSVLIQDALTLDEFFRFDKILLDAPCSGSGTLNPDDPVKISQKLVENSAKLQEKLLRKALKLLKKDGLLVYSTCSILKEENEEIIKKVLSGAQAELLPFSLGFDVPRLKCLENTLCVPPDGLFEGFFCAVIKKL